MPARRAARAAGYGRASVGLYEAAPGPIPPARPGGAARAKGSPQPRPPQPRGSLIHLLGHRRHRQLARRALHAHFTLLIYF